MSNTKRELVGRAAKLAGATALVVLVGSGTLGVAGAARQVAENVPNNSVTSIKIVNNAVASVDIKDGTVAAVDLANDSVGSAEVVYNSIAGSDVTDGGIASADVTDGGITSVDIADGGIASVDVADNSIGGADITNGGVTTFEIADSNVGPTDLADPVKPRWAHINGGTSSVSIIDGRGALGVAHSIVGRYDITFDRDVSHCGWTATRTDNAAGIVAPGLVGVELGANNVVIVRTFDPGGLASDTAEDDGFTVRVDC